MMDYILDVLFLGIWVAGIFFTAGMAMYLGYAMMHLPRYFIDKHYRKRW